MNSLMGSNDTSGIIGAIWSFRGVILGDTIGLSIGDIIGILFIYPRTTQLITT